MTAGAEWWSRGGTKQAQAGGPGDDSADPGPMEPPHESLALSRMSRMDRPSPHHGSSLLLPSMLRFRPCSRNFQWLIKLLTTKAVAHISNSKRICPLFSFICSSLCSQQLNINPCNIISMKFPTTTHANKHRNGIASTRAISRTASGAWSTRSPRGYGQSSPRVRLTVAEPITRRHRCGIHNQPSRYAVLAEP